MPAQVAHLSPSDAFAFFGFVQALLAAHAASIGAAGATKAASPLGAQRAVERYKDLLALLRLLTHLTATDAWAMFFPSNETWADRVARAAASAGPTRPSLPTASSPKGPQ